MKILILVLFLINSLSMKSQNLISNPDFSDVSVEYKNGKQVYPTDWKFFDQLEFYHPAKNGTDNFLQRNVQKSQGIVKLKIRCGDGITTKLKNRLELGKSYDIKIELKIDRLVVNSDFRNVKGVKYFQNGKSLDSIEYDYNYPISLLTYFSTEEPKVNMDKRDFVLFDLPENVGTDSTEWFDLHQTVTANGYEKFFSIGAFTGKDYIDILRKDRNDTINYSHKLAAYLIRNVSIFPINDSIMPINGNGDNTLATIADRFDLDSSLVTTPNHKFIVRKVNFELSSFELSDSTKQEINKIALFMKKNSKFNLNITGHTDSIGTKPYNQILSEKRAEAVCQYLVSLGVEKSRLTSEGKGEEQPLAEKLLKKNFGLNRRVEFEFTAGQQ
jgi:outer membrane protein OmpA-like peptidoglycan-associated protein